MAKRRSVKPKKVPIQRAFLNPSTFQVVCPPVITPGEFFVCTADIPRGSDVTFELEMVDDLNSTMKTNSGWLKAPQQWFHIPGGPLKTQSWNSTIEPPTPPYTRDNYIIQSTYFQCTDQIQF